MASSRMPARACVPQRAAPSDEASYLLPQLAYFQEAGQQRCRARVALATAVASRGRGCCGRSRRTENNERAAPRPPRRKTASHPSPSRNREKPTPRRHMSADRAPRRHLTTLRHPAAAPSSAPAPPLPPLAAVGPSLAPRRARARPTPASALGPLAHIPGLAWPAGRRDGVSREEERPLAAPTFARPRPHASDRDGAGRGEGPAHRLRPRRQLRHRREGAGGCLHGHRPSALLLPGPQQGRGQAQGLRLRAVRHPRGRRTRRAGAERQGGRRAQAAGGAPIARLRPRLPAAPGPLRLRRTVPLLRPGISQRLGSLAARTARTATAMPPRRLSHAPRPPAQVESAVKRAPLEQRKKRKLQQGDAADGDAAAAAPAPEASPAKRPKPSKQPKPRAAPAPAPAGDDAAAGSSAQQQEKHKGMRTVAIGNLTPETVAAALALARKCGQVRAVCAGLPSCLPLPASRRSRWAGLASPAARSAAPARLAARSRCRPQLPPLPPPLPPDPQVAEVQNPAPADAVHRAKLALDGCEGSVVLVVYDTVGGAGAGEAGGDACQPWRPRQPAGMGGPLHHAACLCIRTAAHARSQGR
jgi:hypothetical protein